MHDKITEVLNVKCMNTNHRRDAEGQLGRRVLDFHTMHAHRVGDVVYMRCPWCGYEAEIDLNEITAKQIPFYGFTGKEYIIKL